MKKQFFISLVLMTLLLLGNNQAIADNNGGIIKGVPIKVEFLHACETSLLVGKDEKTIITFKDGRITPFYGISHVTIHTGKKNVIKTNQHNRIVSAEIEQ